MKALPALLIVAILLLGSVPLATEVDASSIEEYPKKKVIINDFELNQASFYGDWVVGYDPADVYGRPEVVNGQIVDDTSSASLTGYYSTDRTQGNFSRVWELSWTKAWSVRQYYAFYFDDYFGGLRFYDVQFDYKIIADVENHNNLTYSVGLQTADPFGTKYKDLVMDGAWHTMSISPYHNDSVPTWFEFDLSVLQRYDPSDQSTRYCNGTIALYLDNIVAYAPACDVRFSFYNAYTGIGLDRSELIIQVWYDGVWTRLWDNEFTIAAGEHIGYKVTDYFGQIVAFVPDLKLLHTTVYVDIPVKLVKVHITKPDWYSTDLPPTWYLTYTGTGKEIPVQGWELELIAGMYSFRWDEMTVSKGDDPLDPDDDLVIEEGSIGQYIDGNLSSGQSFTVTDFYLNMKPTYRSEGSGTMHVIPSLYSWDGLVAAFDQFYEEISTNPLYRGVTLAMGLMGVITFVSAAVYNGKKKAARKLREEQEKRGGKL